MPEHQSDTPSALLPHLPVELIRKIAMFLPPASARDFQRTCRRIHDSCNDWTVWRGVVLQSSAFPQESPWGLVRNEDWKYYVEAEVRASQPLWTWDDVEFWLPHIIALNHPIVLRADCRALFTICHNVEVEIRLDVGNSVYEHMRIGNYSEVPIQTQSYIIRYRRLSQAASFCATAGVLSGQSGMRHAIFILVQQGVRILDNIHELADRRWVSTSQLMANAVAGNMHEMMRLNRAYGSPAHPRPLTKVPYHLFMSPPMPFSRGGLLQFENCHLAAMTDESFITDDAWTGFWWRREPTSRPRFEIIGGQYVNPPQLLQLPFFVGGVVRFRRINQFVIFATPFRSNVFHTQGDLCVLSLHLFNATGNVSIRYRNPITGVRGSPMYGAMTPFGIVASGDREYLWLWKTSWSENV